MNCTICDRPITGFKNQASRSEAEFSGMCEGCQDDFFGPELKVEKTAAVEEFPVVEEPVEEEPAEPRLPDWIMNAQVDLGSIEKQGEVK